MVPVRNGLLRGVALAACLTAGLSLPALSRASLGDDVASIERDRVSLKGTLKVNPQITYEVHEITTPGGRVREYLAGGRVFAVSWDGHSVPDLGQLLGVHVGEFHDLVKPQPGNHHVVSVSNDKLIVTMRKLPRGMEGHVVVPALVPAGVSLAALR